MERKYEKWFSQPLQKEMELLVFGHTGTPVLFFPTRAARFFDYENWRIIEAMRQKIEAGYVQVFCVDSMDAESFYCDTCEPQARIKRHEEYEQYLVQEVVPFIKKTSPSPYLIAAGCSMGAYHAVNVAFRFPGVFTKVVGMSGRYDLTEQAGYFRDLLDGYRDEQVYLNMPNQYIDGLEDQEVIGLLAKLEIILAIGAEDAFLDNNLRLGRSLSDKGVPYNLYVWDEEAHKPRYWRRMVQIYL